ncbi:hypothetical protein HBB16_02890 [Pseudonocardia sp. MCCB 268]|nr:hypothetical protein [Pseudonocardia cytotoxica]
MEARRARTCCPTLRAHGRGSARSSSTVVFTGPSCGARTPTRPRRSRWTPGATLSRPDPRAGEPVPHEPVFDDAPWQAEAFAIAVALQDRGLLTGRSSPRHWALHWAPGWPAARPTGDAWLAALRHWSPIAASPIPVRSTPAPPPGRGRGRHPARLAGHAGRRPAAP